MERLTFWERAIQLAYIVWLIWIFIVVWNNRD
jgi:hypothetical protein